MAPHHDYVPGCTYLTCTFCGRRRLFPDELALCDDKKFRCLDACMEKSIMSIDREIAASHYKREAPPLGIGYASQFDRPLSFLETAAEFRSVVLAGWTPSSQFYDDFTIVPGGVGSSWAVTLTGTGTVTQPSAGIARLRSDGTPGNTARATNASFAIPPTGTGLFFCCARFRVTPANGTPSSVVVGTATAAGSQRSSIGFRGTAGSSYFQLFSQSVGETQSNVEANDGEYHIARMWWRTGSPVFGSIDDSRPLSVPSAGATAKVPSLLLVPFTTSTACDLDVTNYVCWA
jgi:hypothetical protein